MNLVIFGATGGIGRQVLEQAIIAGHDVTAAVRDPKKLSGQKMRVVTADLSTALECLLFVVFTNCLRYLVSQPASRIKRFVSLRLMVLPLSARELLIFGAP